MRRQIPKYAFSVETYLTNSLWGNCFIFGLAMNSAKYITANACYRRNIKVKTTFSFGAVLMVINFTKSILSEH